jgi:ABC-2 type transport system ATP-binding protein
MGVIEVSGLRKEYRRLHGRPTIAIDGLDLSVPEGGVFGFLGPNGSGKTTTIRCLLGLVAPSAGSCRLLGADVRTSLSSVIGQVGAVVESPAFFPSFSARQNLRLLGRLNGIGPRAVDEVLEQVGLAERGDDAVKRYSLGMRQRLGLAGVLLKDPAVLILDEPANGLDPAGIREIRRLLRQLGDEGRTVFVSSHQLGEIQQICDRLAILRGGRCIAAGPVRDLLTIGRTAGLLVRVGNGDTANGDTANALAALRTAGMRVEPADDGLLLVHQPHVAAHVTETLARDRLWVTEMRPQELSLEDVFLELTESAP